MLLLLLAGYLTAADYSFRLEVAQQPVHGRRKTEKDRRPLAPSPVLRLWLKEHRDETSPGVPVDPAWVSALLRVR